MQSILTNCRRILAVVALMTSPAVFAQADPVQLSDPYYAASLPLAGAYFDPTQSGTGMFVDIRENGAAFVTFGVYDPTGQPTWYTLQSPFVPEYAYGNAPTPWQASFIDLDTIGTLHGVVYRSAGGQCPGCTYLPPSTTPAWPADSPLHEATIAWTNTDTARVSMGGGTWTMIRLPLDPAAANWEGRWHLQAWADDAPSTAGIIADSDVTISKLPNADVSISPQGPIPPAHVTDWYRVDCSTACSEGSAARLWTTYNAGGPSGAEVVLLMWRDASTGQAGLEQVEPLPSGAFVGSSFRYTFSLHPDTNGAINGRRAQLPFNSIGFALPAPVQRSLLRLERRIP